MTVCNTSPLTNLAAVGQLALLPRLYGRIHIPNAVALELRAADCESSGYVPIESLGWLVVRSVGDRAFVESLRLYLDEGEAEAIALAMELGADVLLMDEQAGRRIATRLGLERVGAIGVLRRAKSVGLIPAVRPVLDDLIARAGFWIRPSLYASILSDVGE